MAQTVQKKSYIYIIADPADQIVRYVGQNENPESRFRSHLTTARSTTAEGSSVYQWLREVLDLGRTPVLTVIDWITGEWEGEEREWPCEACEQKREENEWGMCEACKRWLARKSACEQRWRQQVLTLERQWCEAYHKAGVPLTNVYPTLRPKEEHTTIRLCIPSRVYSAVWRQTCQPGNPDREV